MSHPLQISHQVSITTSLLPDECASPHGNTSPATPKNLIANPLLPDDDAQDDSDTPFDYDLLLPPPNPLPKKAPPTRDPIQILFEYPLQKAPKFSGKEALDPLSGQESSDTYKNSAKVYSERIKEAILAQSDDSDENREYKRLCDYFVDEEKIVYRRRPQAEGEEFNQTMYNIKTQPRRNMEDSEVGIETNFGENIQAPQKENILRFESRFESGNLSMASMVSENEYNLLLQSDINTYGFGQWFFFAVMNNKKNQTVKFNILNYRKTSSLHNLGMRVLVYSSKEAKKSDIGWSRTSRADYFCNNIPRENPRINNVYRTLSFEYTFKHNADCVFFAYSMPYTYSNLQDYLDSVEMDEIKSRYFGRSTLCRTLAGNKCELVTITQKSKSMDCDKKKCIFLTARVHPGETNSSFVIQGVMDFLLSNSKEAESLREKFIFKIIPMLNPDGVIHGNSRCCLIGSDLNRKWKRPSPKLQPTIYNAKVLASELHQKYGVILYCDFHGHSKKRDTFIYGCQEGNMPLEVREFAFVLGKVSPMFCYRKSSFFVESSKAGTARIALYQEFKIKCSYTLEASFFGPEKTGKPYSLEELFDFGGKFCKAVLLQFSRECVATKKSSIKEIDQELAEAKQKMIEELYSNQENLMNNEPDSGSESELSEDELPRTVIKDLLPKMRKRPPPLKKQPSKTPQKFMKSTMAPLASGSVSSTVQVPSSTALVGEAKILKLSFDRTPLRERYFSKVKSEKFAFPQREAVYITSPGPEAHQDKSPEILDNFCFVVRKLEGKFEPKNETRRQLINTYQEGFLTPDVKPDIKLTYESLATQEKRAEKDREKEERFNRLSKDKRRAGNLIEAKRPGTLSVVNTIKKSFPNLIDRGSPASLSTANLTTTSLSTLKHVRSLKELKSVRDLRIIENGGETENIEDFYPNTSDEIKDMMQNIKDILDGTATTKETRELKDIRDSRDTRDLKEMKDIRTKDPQGRELSESQSRSKIKKTRAAYTLEPIGKATIMNSFEKLDTDPRFKTNTKIKHPGFQRRSEEDGTILRESLKEYSREGQKSSFSSIRELLNPGFKDQFSGLDRWRYNVMIADDQGLKTAIGSPKKMNTQDKDAAGDELQTSVEYATPHRRIKKVEGIGRMTSSSRKQFPNASARTLDIKNSTSLANTLSKVDLSVIQTVSRHKSPLKG